MYNFVCTTDLILKRDFSRKNYHYDLLSLGLASAKLIQFENRLEGPLLGGLSALLLYHQFQYFDI